MATKKSLEIRLLERLLSDRRRRRRRRNKKAEGSLSKAFGHDGLDKKRDIPIFSKRLHFLDDILTKLFSISL